MNYSALKETIKIILSVSNNSRDEKLQAVCQLLYDEISYYNWVGFYFADFDSQTLHLGPYVGAQTDHIKIAFGKGICGQVAVSNQNFIVPDVAAQNNYIACSTTVKSEIVIPLFVNDKNIGQIDIDSHTIDAFSKKDTKFLRFVNNEIAKLF